MTGDDPDLGTRQIERVCKQLDEGVVGPAALGWSCHAGAPAFAVLADELAARGSW